MSESFLTAPLQSQLPAYLYVQYAADPDLQAFIASYNGLTQGYLDWFNNTPLGVYTSPGISGSLLDWVGQGVYGVSRPVLSSLTSQMIAGINSVPTNTEAINANELLSSGTATIANDDIYKRVLTWIFYRGDGKVFSIQWLKNRVARFLNGPNGTDYTVLNFPPSITVSDGVYTISVPDTLAGICFAQCVSSGRLPFPFQYTFNVTVLSAGSLTVTAPVSGMVGTALAITGAITPAANPVNVQLSTQNMIAPISDWSSATNTSGAISASLIPNVAVVGTDLTTQAGALTDQNGNALTTSSGTVYAWVQDAVTGLSVVSSAIAVVAA